MNKQQLAAAKNLHAPFAIPALARLWPLLALACLTSACMMTVEIVAGRLIAPYAGVSLYTWTSVIAVVLAGMSAGGYASGSPTGRSPAAARAGRCWPQRSQSRLWGCSCP
jgi:hypothetical protein